MIIDTHCHLDFKDFDSDRDAVIDRAKEKGIVRIVNVGSSLEGSRRAVDLAKKYDIVYASVGIHPHEANSVTDQTIEDLKSLLSYPQRRAPLRVPYDNYYDSRQSKVIAIGEVGLDYYRNLSPKEDQIKAFEKFIQLALDLNLPLIIHSREADVDVLDILKKYEQRTTNNEQRINGVMHCFSGDKNFLEECLDLELYISFTCNLTFRNAKNLREVAKIVPVEKLLLETDAPFLSPEGMRGKRNEPSYLTYLVDEWALLTGLSKDDIERITTHNANKLFKLNVNEEESKIAYKIRDSLYLNITNACTNDCDFCVRTETAFVKGHNLKLEKEPTVEEVLKAVEDPKKYKEIVFCGYGEPTTRLDAIKAISKELKKKGAKLRLVTNGHGDLINKRPIAKELLGLIDKVSVSLNTDKEDMYQRVCKPKFGAETYKAVLKFIRDCVENNIAAEVTCLNLEGVDLKECERIAKGLGASFRVRIYGVTG